MSDRYSDLTHYGLPANCFFKQVLWSMNKAAIPEASSSGAQELSFGIQLNCLICIFYFVTQNIKITCTQRSGFNKINICYHFMKAII